ncbi:MAG: hypothetical protein BroJett040_01340 [Oligoflexia bacterium]|nr:MAG: hypothetical protein BroJett040_01340 [Oligoflexia bacterium]
MKLDNIPKPLLVVGVIVVGLALFPLIQKPHTVCDSQLNVFKEAQKGVLYSYKVKNVTRPAVYPKALEACKYGNSSGACYEYFQLVRKFLRDVQNLPSDCSTEMDEVKEIKKVFVDSLRLFGVLAWGDKPPEPETRAGWFDLSDQALFCAVKDQWMRFYGQESWDQFRLSIHQELPGEEARFETNEAGERKCVNCESLKKAPQVFASPEEIFVRTIYSIPCNRLDAR